MPKIFDSVQMARPSTNKFDLSHEKKFSFNMGQLVPMLVKEMMPGDSFRVNTEVMLRLAPMLAPVMHRVNVFTHYFFVPNRLIWDEWETFITGGPDGLSAPVWPHIVLDDSTKASFQESYLPDYMGIPPVVGEASISAPISISALPFRAYQLINDEYYRDQNVMSPSGFSKASGAMSDGQTSIITTMRYRCWEKDYFTSALPWAQRGAEVSIPIEGAGSVTYKPISSILDEDGLPANMSTLIGTSTSLVTGDMVVNKADASGSGNYGRIENIDEVTLENVNTTINDLRRSIKLQEWLEKNARGGSRYTEQIRSHFGVVSSDARLQRPEYLGGGKQPVVISEVLSSFQSADGEGEPQGNMAGHGISVGNSNGFRYRAEEHGFVIGIISVLPRTVYQQGIERMWLRDDKFKYPWPSFAQLGEQEVQQQELYADYFGTPENNNATFGYQSRYSEFKYTPSTVAGVFRSSLAYWHMGRIFNSAPSLDSGFVQADPTTRIFAVEDEAAEHLYCQLYHNISAIRPLPYYGTPTL